MKKIAALVVMLQLLTACHFTKAVMKEQPVPENYQEVVGHYKHNLREEPKPDKYPMYLNGMQGIMQDLGKNLKYPRKALKKGIQGKVVVEFVVDEKGDVSQVKVVRSVYEDVDKEAVRLISNLKKFRPGYSNGKPVKVIYRLPIVFRIDE